MFTPLPFITQDLSLTAVIERCKNHPLVMGIVETGSGGRGQLKPESDYDLIIILETFPITLDVMLTTIDGRMSDIIFVRQSVIKAMLIMDGYDGNTQEGVLFDWVRDGAIHYDKTGHLTKIKSSHTTVRPEKALEKYNVWFRVNFNLLHTRRLLQSRDTVYLMAFDLRMLYTLSEVWLWFLTVRDIAWRGDKESVRYMQTHYPDALMLHQQAIHTSNREQKFAYHEAFCSIALEPVGGIWQDHQITVFNKVNPEHPANMDDLLMFWRDLLQKF